MTTGWTRETQQVVARDSFGGPAPARGGERAVRYRLDVTASCVADAVRCAGGWIFDCAMGGWDVNVLLPPGCDARPLEILGANILELKTAAAKVEQARVFFWGENLSADLRADPAQHHLSAAARAFKAHALIAADITPTVSSHETFWAPTVSTRWGTSEADRLSSSVMEAIGAQVVTSCPVT